MKIATISRSTRPPASARARRRGNAEIELMLAIPLLLTILFMVAATLKLGVNRIANIFQTQADAYPDATTAATPQYAPSESLSPIEGLLSVRDGLPNRVHVADLKKTVNFTQNSILPLGGKSLGDSSTFISPPWAYSIYPTGSTSDSDMTQEWLQQYVDESHANIQAPLGLADAWPP